MEIENLVKCYPKEGGLSTYCAGVQGPRYAGSTFYVNTLEGKGRGDYFTY